MQIMDMCLLIQPEFHLLFMMKFVVKTNLSVQDKLCGRSLLTFCRWALTTIIFCSDLTFVGPVRNQIIDPALWPVCWQPFGVYRFFVYTFDDFDNITSHFTVCRLFPLKDQRVSSHTHFQFLGFTWIIIRQFVLFMYMY